MVQFGFGALRKIELLLFNFFGLFSLGNEIIQTRVKQMFCYWGFLSISLSILAGAIYSSLCSWKLWTSLFFCSKEIFFCICCCVIVSLSIKTNFVCLTNYIVLLPDYAKYKDGIQRRANAGICDSAPSSF